MNQYYDYCDTYDSYYSGLTLDNCNKIKTFSCSVCKQSKLVLKKSVGDSVFKCDECIEAFLKEHHHDNHVEENQVQQQDQKQEPQEPQWRWFSFF